MKAINARSIYRFFLAMLFGGLIGAFLAAVVVIRANAQPLGTQDADAQMVCNTIASNPNNAGLDAAVLLLLGKGYMLPLVSLEISNAISYDCPQYFKLAQSWANTPTGTNGLTPVGELH